RGARGAGERHRARVRAARAARAAGRAGARVRRARRRLDGRALRAPPAGRRALRGAVPALRPGLRERAGVNRQTLRSALLVAASLGLATGLFFTCFERTTREIPAGYSREALDNPYLALGRLLERMRPGLTVLHGPPPPGPGPPGPT